MIGNDRLYLATRALIEGQGNAKARVVSAMRILDNLVPSEFTKCPDIWDRIVALRQKTSFRGPLRHKGLKHVLRDAYEHTATNRQNITYSKFAIEIFEIWRMTC